MRLTRKDENGNWSVEGLPWGCLREGQVITEETRQILYGCLCKLKDYEDSGLTPEQIYDMDKSFSHMCNIVNNKWIPVEQRLPENDDFILLSFANFSLPQIGRYEKTKDGGGSFYIGDDGKPLFSYYGLLVNAWMPLTDPYRPEEDIQ